jgi:hypothetical protein
MQEVSPNKLVVALPTASAVYSIDPETPCRGLRRGSAGMPGNQRGAIH